MGMGQKKIHRVGTYNQHEMWGCEVLTSAVNKIEMEKCCYPESNREKQQS